MSIQQVLRGSAPPTHESSVSGQGTANEGFLKRTLDYLSFMLMGFAMALFERRPDVVVATSPQFFCAIAGWAVSVARGRPFVFELRDLWPASNVAVGAMRKSVVIRALERVEGSRVWAFRS